MTNQETPISRAYAEAVFQRATTPMEPGDFAPNWNDRPFQHKLYRNVERIPLAARLPASVASMAEVLARLDHTEAGARDLTFGEFSTLLLITHSLLSRRLGVNWNPDSEGRAQYRHAVYSRGTASGGGLYPTEIYWACGQSGPLLPGIYHYDSMHHAMERLSIGDPTPRLRAAVAGNPAAAVSDQFLLIALNFWKNSFKYNTFCYHVVTQDLGALYGSLRLMARGFGADLQFLLWYDDEELNRLLGLETMAESVFAVVPIPLIGRHPTASALSVAAPFSASAPATRLAKLDAPPIDKASFQRSKAVIRFPLLEQVHQATLIGEQTRPDPVDAVHACSRVDTAGEQIDLPPPLPERLQSDILEVFKKRSSSFGRFSGHKPLALADLATTLYFGAAACNYASDLKQPDRSPHFTRLVAFVNNVQGLKRGAYAYDHDLHCLWTICKDDLSFFLQKNYFLQNYNLEETGAVIAVVGSIDRMIEVYGDRGYRILNAEAGLVAQNIYMVTTALSVGCGAVLGFDNIALNKLLRIENTNEQTIILLLIGYERKDSAGVDCRLI